MITYGPQDSRCMYVENAPQHFHWAVLAGDPAIVVRELQGVIRASVPRAAWVDALAQVRAVIERFERCTAIHPDDVKRIAGHPDLWEVRIDLETFGVLIRIYETEIDQLPGDIVALRVHRKVIFPGSRDRTNTHQNRNIAIAGARWDSGRPTYWGVQ